MFRCVECDAYFSDGGPVNYDDVDLTKFCRPYTDVIRASCAKFRQFIERSMRLGRLLDIGAGMGFSIEVARDRGWAATGLEPNIALARYAVEQGLDVRRSYLGSDTVGEFELVLIDNVLVHIPEPLPFLANAARLLSSTCLLVIAIPPFDWLRSSLGRLTYVRDRVSVPQLNVFNEVDEHVNVFGRLGMVKLAGRVGLRPLNLRFHHSRVFDNPFARALAIDDGYHFFART
jgi:SAM-dependent methyltransferase